MAARIQRKRTPGWTLAGATENPLGAVIVDRSSRYGNPFVIVSDRFVRAPAAGPYDGQVWTCPSDEGASKWAAHLYDDWLNGTGPDVYRVKDRAYDRRVVLAALADGTLAGRDLACTCPLPEPGQPDHCHGAVLLRRASGGAA